LVSSPNEAPLKRRKLEVVLVVVPEIRYDDVATIESSNESFGVEVSARIGDRLNVGFRFLDFRDLIRT
jgi:hypothetical protein